MKKRLTGIFAIAAVWLTGCTPVTDQPEPTGPDVVATSPAPASPVVDETEHAWVQDLWVYESISKIDETGSFIDLTDDIITHLAATTGEEHDLPQGASFVVHPHLKPTIVGADGTVRTDVEVIAGLLVDGHARGLAVLATPDADAPAPIGLGDLVEVDLTFIDGLTPGDVLSADVAFLQAFMGTAPSGLHPVELLATRLETGQVQFYGSGGDVGVYPMELGQAVPGSTRGQLPAKAGPMMDGFEDGFEGCKGDTKCVSDYFESFGAGALDSLDLLNCNLGGPCGETPSEDSDDSKTPSDFCVVGVKGGGCADVTGDPHITTLDGRKLNMQAVGEFLGLRGEGLEVQMRTTAWHDSRKVSLLSAVAIRSGAGTVMVDIAEDDLRVRVDGQDAALEVGSELELTGLTVAALPGVVQASTPGGELVTVRRTGAANLGLWVSVDEDSAFTGMLTGTGLSQEYDHAELYGQFVNYWRVSDANSAFAYDSGRGTADFTDLTFPDEVVTLGSLPARDRDRALAVCTAAGIVSPTILAECAFDYAVTGSVEFVRAAKFADHIDGLSTGRIESRPPVDNPVAAADAWSATATEHAVGDIVSYRCPADGKIETIWGGNGGIYTADSSVCSAAVHQGGLTTERGGTVTIERTAGRETYGSGTAKNGVSPRDWDRSWSGSFTITSVRR